MSNQLNPDKSKIIYAEWSEVRDYLREMADETGKKEGRDISEAEMMRGLTLDAVNKWRKAQGKEALDLDPASAPGGRPPNRLKRST